MEKKIPNFEIRFTKKGYIQKNVYCHHCKGYVIIDTNFPDCVFCGLFLGYEIGLELVPVSEEERKPRIDIQVNHLFK